MSVVTADDHGRRDAYPTTPQWNCLQMLSRLRMNTIGASLALQSVQEISAVSMWTVGLLAVSNIFMTFAWYGHLKFKDVPLWQVTLISWGIALFEYMLMVPANRLGAQAGWNGFELKVTQEVITLTVFTVFALTYLREKLQWNYAVAFLCLIAAVVFTFGFKKASG